MTRSRKKPFVKIKSRWFQKYYNRQERRLAKDAIRKGQYGLAEKRMTSPSSYDVIDYVSCLINHPNDDWVKKASRK